MFAVPEGRGYGALLLEAAAELDPQLDPAVALTPTAAAREALLTHGCWEEAVPGFDDLDAAGMLASPEVGERLGVVLNELLRLEPRRRPRPIARRARRSRRGAASPTLHGVGPRTLCRGRSG